jgi:hypothetical protein
MQLVGRIITHAFLLFEMSPVQISYTSLKHIFFGAVRDDELLDSFFKNIPENEANIIKALSNGNGNSQACMDILSEFRVFGLPTSENIISLCKRTAHVCMVQSPCFKDSAEGMEHLQSSSNISGVNVLKKPISFPIACTFSKEILFCNISKSIL